MKSCCFFPNRHSQLGSAERKGFEPLDPKKRSTVFETAPFDHSGISPYFQHFKGIGEGLPCLENGCKDTTFFE